MMRMVVVILIAGNVSPETSYIAWTECICILSDGNLTTCLAEPADATYFGNSEAGSITAGYLILNHTLLAKQRFNRGVP
jgi:hypothetical protein